MKNHILLLDLFLLVGFALSCEKHNEKTVDTINVTGIKAGTTSEVVNVELKSGTIKTNPIECYIMGSTLIDPRTGGFGYVDCYNQFKMINPLTGTALKSFNLPGPLSQLVIDSVDNCLIGRNYEVDSNFVYRISLENGEVLARNAVDLFPGITMCTYFYNSAENEYVLMRADSMLITINPQNGEITDSTKTTSMPFNTYYDATEKMIIGLTYSLENEQNYLVTMDVETGEILHNVQVKERHNYYMCVAGFDSRTNCYVTVTDEDKILFIDINTGEIRDSYETYFKIQEFKFWRGR